MKELMFNNVKRFLPSGYSETFLLWSYSFFKIPMILFTSPRVVELSFDRSEIVIPLTRRTKNHFNCMYFGALAVGADCAAGLLAMYIAAFKGKGVSFLFKDLKADFLKRAEGDVHFISEEGGKIKTAIEQAKKSGERINLTVPVTAKVPSKSDEPVASMILTISLKSK